MAVSIFNFKKEPPPPPPPRVPAWVVQLITPFIMAIVLGLVAFIGNGFTEDLKEIKSQVEEVDKNKVDNTTLKLLIQNQNIIIQHQQEEAEKQRKENAEKFEALQRTQTKTLERIEVIQAPRNIVVEPKYKSAPVGDALTPEEFERYLNMSPETQKKYKKYLQERGRDVSGLP